MDVDPTLERHVGKVFPQQGERLALEQLLRELLASPAFAAVERLLEAEASAVSRPMDASMKPLETAEYAARHGRLGGLRAFRAAAEAIVLTAQEERVELEHEAEAGEAPEEALTHG